MYKSLTIIVSIIFTGLGTVRFADLILVLATFFAAHHFAAAVGSRVAVCQPLMTANAVVRRGIVTTAVIVVIRRVRSHLSLHAHAVAHLAATLHAHAAAVAHHFATTLHAHAATVAHHFAATLHTHAAATIAHHFAATLHAHAITSHFASTLHAHAVGRVIIVILGIVIGFWRGETKAQRQERNK